MILKKDIVTRLELHTLLPIKVVFLDVTLEPPNHDSRRVGWGNDGG